MKASNSSWDSINDRIVRCKRCPRLRAHCQEIAREKRKAFHEWTYWGKPVPNFGDPKARLLILGLAPAAHGANRTGRMFTGDRSGEWLYRALYRAQFANQAHAESLKDGLYLTDAVITATAHCAPPDNKPTTEEIENCRSHLQALLKTLPVKVIVALGGIAWQAVLKEAKEMGWLSLKSGKTSKFASKFAHGAEFLFENDVRLLGSYHPSQQNTFTGRLTEPMLDSIFLKAASLLKAHGSEDRARSTLT